MSDKCSVWSFDEIKKSGYVGRGQAQYLYVFSNNNMALSHREASNLVEFNFLIKVPARNGRIAELEKMGFLKKYDTVRCSETNKMVNRWRYTGRKEPLTITSIFTSCPHCNGRGKVFKHFHMDTSKQTDLFKKDGN